MGIRYQDISKIDQESTNDDRIQQGSEVIVRRDGCDNLSQGRTEELVENYEKVNLTRRAGFDRQPGSEVLAGEIEGLA